MSSHSSPPPPHSPSPSLIGPQGADTWSASASPAPTPAAAPSAIVRDPRVVGGALPSSHHSTPFPPPPLQPILTSVISAIPTPPSAFRYQTRLNRAHSRSFGSLTGGRTTPEHLQHRQPLGPEFSSTSSLETSGSSMAARGRPYARAGQSSPSDSARRRVRGVQRYADYDEEDRPNKDEDEDDDGDLPRHASGASDADSEQSARGPGLETVAGGGAGGREGLLIPMGETFHAKKKRTRVLPTAHQSAELNKLLSETPFPSTARREELGRKIGLSARKVQVWFQNRRQKARRANDETALKHAPELAPAYGSPSTSPASLMGSRPSSSRPYTAHPPPSAWYPTPAVAGSSVSPVRHMPLSDPRLPPQQPYGHAAAVPPSPSQPYPYAIPTGYPQSYVSSPPPAPPPTTRHYRPTSWQEPREPREPGSSVFSVPGGRDGPRRGTRSHERVQSLDRTPGPDSYAPPPSSYHPYGSRPGTTRSRRSPTRWSNRHDPREPSPTRLHTARPPSPLSFAYDSDDLRLPPLILPATVPSSPGPSRESSHPRARHSLDFQTTPVSPSQAFPTLSSSDSERPPLYPPPFTLQPQPLWDHTVGPDYFDRRPSMPRAAGFIRHRRDGNASRPSVSFSAFGPHPARARDQDSRKEEAEEDIVAGVAHCLVDFHMHHHQSSKPYTFSTTLDRTQSMSAHWQS